MKIVAAHQILLVLSAALAASKAEEVELLPIEGFVWDEDLPPIVLNGPPPDLPCPSCGRLDSADGPHRERTLATGKEARPVRQLTATEYYVDFEDLGNNATIGDAFLNGPGGLSFEQFAHSLIDEEAGGTGYFANEPSSSTVMFYPLASSAPSSSFFFEEGVTSLKFSYSSATSYSSAVAFYFNPVTNIPLGIFPLTLMQNHDKNGCTGDVTGHYCNWDPRAFPSIPGTVIKRVVVQGRVLDYEADGLEGSALNHLLIDDLVFTLPSGGAAGGGGAPVVVTPAGAGGDPHFLRWKQGKRDSFHGECDLVMVNNPDFNKGQGLDIHLRTTMMSWFSYIEAAAVRIGETVLEFNHDVFSINGVTQNYDELPYIISDSDRDFEIVRKQKTLDTGKIKDYVQVVLSSESSIDIRFTTTYLSVKLNGSEADFGTSKGLLGDFATGDMVGRSGDIFDNYQDFGFEWQVNPEDPQLFAHQREPQLPYEKCRMPDNAAASVGRRLRAQNKKLYNEATQACAGSSDYDLCIDDVLATGEVDIADAFF